MNLLTIVTITAAILTLLSIFLLLVTIGLRVFTDRSLDHEADFRKHAIPLIKSFLRGEATIEVCASILRKDPQLALQFLMEETDSLDEEGRKTLHPLFAAFPLLDRELKALKSTRWQTRLHAAERLGYLGEDAALPALMTALRDNVVGVRFAEARSLVQLGCHDAVEPILLGLDVPGEISQRRVTEIISPLGTRAIDPVLNILKNNSFDDASLAIAARIVGILRAEAGFPSSAISSSTKWRMSA